MMACKLTGVYNYSDMILQFREPFFLSLSGEMLSVLFLIQFLVGMKGKDEAMAIGGHWSPSLDGPDPEKDPSVLIKTAIRCCRALTGIDLSVCTQW